MNYLGNFKTRATLGVVRLNHHGWSAIHFTGIPSINAMIEKHRAKDSDFPFSGLSSSLNKMFFYHYADERYETT